MSQSQLTPAASENLATSTNGKVSSKTPQLEETTSIQTVEAETPTEEIDEANNLVPAPTPSTPKQKRPLFLAIGAIALGALAIGGWKYWEFASTHVSTENAQIQGHLSPIAAKISANVQQVLVKEGDYVEEGQVLVVMTDQDLPWKLQQEQIHVQANFKETELHKLEVGKSAIVTIDAYPNEKFSATIAGISPATGASFALIPPDNATGNFNKVTHCLHTNCCILGFVVKEIMQNA